MQDFTAKQSSKLAVDISKNDYLQTLFQLISSEAVMAGQFILDKIRYIKINPSHMSIVKYYTPTIKFCE